MASRPCFHLLAQFRLHIPISLSPGMTLRPSICIVFMPESRKSKSPILMMCALIERSLGSSDSFPIVDARSAFMEVAHEVAVRVPATQVIRNMNELRDSITRTGLPIVLKANGTSGGDGVRIAHTLADAERFFGELQAPPLFAKAVKRAVVDHDKTLLWPSILRQRPVVNAQAYIAGHEATSTVVCWQGTVLASLHFEVVKKASSAGHATVVRRIENPEMSAGVEAVVRRLGLSGFFGFDFMLETGTRNAYLIEVNPRSTQVGHLSLGAGHDLPAALFAVLVRKDSANVAENHRERHGRSIPARMDPRSRKHVPAVGVSRCSLGRT